MNKALAILFFVALQSLSNIAIAQAPQPDEAGRQKWMKEVRNYKHDFLVKELDLSSSQQKQFFADYDQMEDRIYELNSETRELEQKVSGSNTSTDLEKEAAARALFQLKSDEGKIELEYFDKFRNSLSPDQLIKLKKAERKFTQALMQHHRRLKKADGPHHK